MFTPPLSPGRVLRHYPEPFQPRSPLEPLGNAGGFSGASFWRFRSSVVLLGLKAWPADRRGGIRRTDVESAHGALFQASEHDRSLASVLPVPFLTRDGRSVVEEELRFWELVPWLPGEPDLNHTPDSTRIKSAFNGLARLHLALGRSCRIGPSLGLLDRCDALEALEFGGFDDLASSIRTDSIEAAARSWIILARRTMAPLRNRLRTLVDVDFKTQACLGDARPDHFLFEGPRLSGILDFAAMKTDTVAADLGRLISGWFERGSELRGIALAAYEAVRPLSREELAAIPAFEQAAAFLAGESWIRWHYQAGRRFDDSEAPRLGLERSVARMLDLLGAP